MTMISQKDVEHIAELSDIGIIKEELDEFTVQANKILDYFDILDQVEGGSGYVQERFNVFRDDIPGSSLTPEDALKNAGATEDGFFKAPRVM
jgi:aspartyl-tRNA(Asn)/glutamyl-tRNA(Gln) amidotransferase subunit C